MTALLETRNLTKSFGGIRASDNLNLSVHAGEIHAIIGPNGAGKTTLISQLIGTTKPDTGTIHYQGRNITGLPAHRRAQIGLTRSFQITSLITDMTALDNVALAVQAQAGTSFRFIKPVRTEHALTERAMASLAQVDLTEKADTPVHALSHGEHRKIEIAIALAANADCMLLDEPMAGLGPEETTAMVSLLQTLKGTRTIVLIEHDMDAVFALADRISVLVYGAIIATGTPDQIRANKDVEAAYLGDETAAP